MGLFNKQKRQERRQKRRERRQARIRNAAEIMQDAVDKGKDVAERVSSGEAAKLRKREDRIVRSGERVLVVFSEFNEDNENKKIMERLYGFVERQGVAVASSNLGNRYDRVIPCTGSRATLSELIDIFKDVLADNDIDEIDLIWHGHGTDKGSDGYFFSMAPDSSASDDNQQHGNYHVDDIADAFEDIDADERLRMFYTTACYGQQLAKSLVESGFSCGAGALYVNANSALEYPAFVRYWSMGVPFGVALSRAFRKSRWRATDTFVRTLMDKQRFGEVDSTKRQFGDVMTNIRTNGDF